MLTVQQVCIKYIYTGISRLKLEQYSPRLVSLSREARTRASCFYPMQYTKPPTLIDDQLTQLESRGLLIPDRDRARRYFKFISYYRLSGYFLPYQVPNDSNHIFLPDATFDDILSLCIFDRKLRLLTMDEIFNIGPQHLRTSFSVVEQKFCLHSINSHKTERLFAQIH